MLRGRGWFPVRIRRWARLWSSAQAETVQAPASASAGGVNVLLHAVLARANR